MINLFFIIIYLSSVIIYKNEIYNIIENSIYYNGKYNSALFSKIVYLWLLRVILIIDGYIF